MANYDAQINILVSGQRNINNLLNQLNQVEGAIGQIESRWRVAAAAIQRADVRLGVIGRQQPRGEGGRFARDPDRQARMNAAADRRAAVQDLARARGSLRIEAQRAALVREQIDGNQRILRQSEARITFEQRLNSAVELFQTRQQKFARGGGGRALSQELQDKARSIQAAYEAAGGSGARNLRLVNALATGLGRVVERQNEFNRLQALGSKGFEAGRRLQERITAASSVGGLSRQRVAAARSLATETISASRSGNQQAYEEALRKATAATARLERESNELARAINDQEREIARIARIGPRSPVRGGVNFPGSPIALREQQREQERALSKAQRGFPSSPILGTASMAGSPRAIQAQERSRAAADRALRAQERVAKAAETAADKALRESQRGYPASPISGTASMAGSPRALQAQERARAAADRALMAQERAAKVAETAASKALAESQKGYPSSPILGTATTPGSPRWKTAQQAAEKKLEAAARAVETAANKALAEAQKGYPSSPILGGVKMPGSPIFKQTPFLERRFSKRGSAAISEGLIGGAFPLLFGQGAGASLGGLAGGAAGGFAGGGLGFGLSLIGTALGTAFDQLSQAAQETGKSLNYPIEGFEKLKEAGLFANRQQEYYISKLIETGQTSKATAEIQAEMIKKIGVSGVNDLTELGDTSYRLSKTWAEFNLQLQAALAGPMSGLLDWVTSVLNLANQSFRSQQLVKDVSAGLSGEEKQKFDREIQKINLSEQIGATWGPLFGGLNAMQATKQRTALAEFYAPSAKPIEIKPGKPDPEQEQANLDKAIERADKARALAQQGIALERSGMELRLSIEDTVYGLRKRATDMEREAVEFRRSMEDQIFSKRQELEQRLIENDRKRQQNAIDAFDLQLQKASVGLDPIAQGVVEAAGEYLRVRAEGEADLQQAEKQLKLELQQIDQEVNRYKLQVEDRVSQMAIQRDEFSRDVSRARLQIENQIADRAVQVEEYRLAMAKHRYEVEVDLEKKKQIVAQEGLAVAATGGYTGTSVDGFPITSRPGMRWGEMHKGFDIAAPIGTALGYEIGGEILSAGWIKGYGNTLRVKLENGLTILSGHLNEIFVTAGQKFKANQRLATVGTTGKSTGPHVHQESWMNGKADPSASLPFLQLGKAVSDKTAPRAAGASSGAAAAAQTASGAVGAAPVLQPAPAMPTLPAAPQLVGINDLMQQYLAIVEKIKAATKDTNSLQIESNAIAAERARLTMQEQAMAPIRQAEQLTREIYEEIEVRKLRNRLMLEGFAPEIIEGKVRVLELERNLAKAVMGYDIVLSKLIGTTYDGTTATYESAAAKLKELEAISQLTPAQAALKKELEAILKARQGIKDATGGAQKGAEEAAAASIVSPREKVEGRIGELKKELADLTNPANMAISAAERIGSAFGDSFRGIVSGSMTAQEALAGFFQSVADHFLDMAAQIISKWIYMTILNSILKLFPGGSLMSAASPEAAAIGQGSSIFAAANGAQFGNGIVPFAMGGAFANSIVSSPTLFKFADGGAMKTGLMGEAGPEAVMPLKRGPDGKLGVMATGGGGGVVVNVSVDASGSKVEGDNQGAGQLGRVIAGAVQAELIKQKRPGGLLA